MTPFTQEKVGVRFPTRVAKFKSLGLIISINILCFDLNIIYFEFSFDTQQTLYARTKIKRLELNQHTYRISVYKRFTNGSCIE